MGFEESLQLEHGALPNRLAKAALSERLALPDGAPSRELVRLYEHWAWSGAGLILTGNVMVDGRALGEQGNPVLEDTRHSAAFQKLAMESRRGGAKIWMQINHPGRQSPRYLSKQPVAPSAVPIEGLGGAFKKPRALTEDEIRDLIQRFANTAALAEETGFDGVQIHGAHGYLISQFLSPKTNLRTDAWGGDGERRRRFLFEVIAAVRARVSAGFSVGLKLNSADFQRGGFTQEESMDVVRALEGIDLLEISGGTYESAAMFQEPHKADSTRQREAFFLDYAEQVRAMTRVPLMVTGGFRTAAGMTAALAQGGTDVIGLGRPLVMEPDLGRCLLDGSAEAARPVHLNTGIKFVDNVVQGSWYQLQLERLGRGRAPDPGLSRLQAFLGYVLPRRRLHAVA